MKKSLKKSEISNFVGAANSFIFIYFKLLKCFCGNVQNEQLVQYSHCQYCTMKQTPDKQNNMKKH